MTQLLAHDSSDTAGSNRELQARLDNLVTITAWPSDLVISIELRLVRSSLADALRSFRMIRSSDSFRSAEEYLLVPKAENVSPVGAITHRIANDTEAITPKPIMESGFRRLPPTKEDLERYLGESIVGPHGMLVIEGDAGDVRLSRGTDATYGVYAALWLSDDLVQVGEDVLAALPEHGNSSSLKRSCRETISELLRRSVAMLENEIGNT